MTEQGSPSGPDLTAGVALDRIPDGGTLRGQVDGEAVVLARVGDEVFAIGAECTHYGGPLDEGLVVGDTVRCPWHHACFSLRTGEAVRAPALDPVATWEVAREGNNVTVAGKRSVPASSAPPPAAPASIVIVGAGAAGLAAAQMLRREGYAGPVTLIGAEASGPVDRPNLSKDYLAGTAGEDSLPLRPPEFYDEQRIDLLTGVVVTAIDGKRRKVTLDDGRVLDYGGLLLATGAEPIRLTVPGADLPHVHYLRSQDDSQAIIAAAEAGTRVVVVGGSFIGLEVAASLRTRGLEVEVVTRQPPLAGLLGPAVGAFVQALHEAQGVTVHLDATVATITPETVTLADGTTLPADLVVAGIGVQPRTELAAAAGLTIDGGVVVDEFLQTSLPGVFAAGDIASFPDPRTGARTRIEHWVVAERQGQAAARNLLGRQERYADVPFFWSHQYDVALDYVGHVDEWDEVVIHGSLADRDATVTYRRDGRALAVLTVGRNSASLAAEAEMERALATADNENQR